jgi:hypothetical protein
MERRLVLGNGSALVVVAHPDDETIWMGGTILMHPQVDWTVISLCRGSDPDRAPKFKKVCARLGARGFIYDVEDEGVMNICESVPVFEGELRKVLRGEIPRLRPDGRRGSARNDRRGGFTYVFTHGYNGEYGHPRHKGVYRGVKNLLDSGIFRAGRVFHFAYELPEGRTVTRPRSEADVSLVLPRDQYEEKRRIVHELYGFKKSSFEVRACSRREAFTIS